MKKLIFIALFWLTAISAQAATMTITVPNNVATQVVEAFAEVYNYQDQIAQPDGTMVDNPETKSHFAKRMIRQFVREVYKAGQVQAIEAQRQAIVEQADNETLNVVVD